ncbi:MAG: helix-turn-helix domain-containing protein [Rhodospirillaceae bacterium]
MNRNSRSPSLPRLLNLDQVADYLCVSTRTVRRMIDNKTLRSVQVGRQKRVDPKDLDAFVNAHKT